MEKNSFILGVIIILLGAAIFLVTFTRQRPIKNFPSSGTDIIAFGDSLVEGVGASNENKNFVSLLSHEIGKPIINLGVSGDTTAQGLERIALLDKYSPKVVILLLGGNDYLQKVPEETTFNNLSKIIENIEARGAVVLLLGVKGSLIGDKFEKQFEKLHDEYNTAYVPNVLSGIFGNVQYMSDAVHPNDIGYQMIASKVYPVLAPLVK
jgi:acyl-CoA thioesterase-1